MSSNSDSESRERIPWWVKDILEITGRATLQALFPWSEAAINLTKAAYHYSKGNSEEALDSLKVGTLELASYSYSRWANHQAMSVAEETGQQTTQKETKKETRRLGHELSKNIRTGVIQEGNKQEAIEATRNKAKEIKIAKLQSFQQMKDNGRLKKFVEESHELAQKEVGEPKIYGYLHEFSGEFRKSGFKKAVWESSKTVGVDQLTPIVQTRIQDFRQKPFKDTSSSAFQLRMQDVVTSKTQDIFKKSISVDNQVRWFTRLQSILEMSYHQSSTQMTDKSCEKTGSDEPVDQKKEMCA